MDQEDGEHELRWGELPIEPRKIWTVYYGAPVAKLYKIKKPVVCLLFKIYSTSTCYHYLLYYTPPKPHFSTRIPMACQRDEHLKKLLHELFEVGQVSQTY